VGEVDQAPNVMLGYLNRLEETAEALRNGWFHTGDLGYRDDDGYFYIVDRKKDMIIKGGFNIYPREIEEVLFQLPEVAEAAVIGAFDEAKGEHIVAVVAFKPESLTEANRGASGEPARQTKGRKRSSSARASKGPTEDPERDCGCNGTSGTAIAHWKGVPQTARKLGGLVPRR
jgi:acyl-CoA synthetase (AMP-forming)/AMP-acid ligase II